MKRKGASTFSHTQGERGGQLVQLRDLLASVGVTWKERVGGGGYQGDRKDLGNRPCVDRHTPCKCTWIESYRARKKGCLTLSVERGGAPMLWDSEIIYILAHCEFEDRLSSIDRKWKDYHIVSTSNLCMTVHIPCIVYVARPSSFQSKRDFILLTDSLKWIHSRHMAEVDTCRLM